jgi:hypothetical protein
MTELNLLCEMTDEVAIESTARAFQERLSRFEMVKAPEA